MGKIDSREIGEVDSHTDSGSSLLLIKYATESQSICFQQQRGEAAQEWGGRDISHNLFVHSLSLGFTKVFSFFILTLSFVLGTKGDLSGVPTI